MKNMISELKNTVERIKSRLGEAEDEIRKLESKVGKKNRKNKKGKKAQKMKRS